MKKALLFISLLVSSLVFSQEVKIEVSTQKIEVGQKAPLFTAQRLDGKTVSLKKLKGNLVLLDFWASWCGPCRQENPNVVKLYDELKNTKFSNGKKLIIVSISLDRQEEPWIAAIQKDQLKWDDHIWDNKGEIAKSYNVRFIPSAFLIDGKGNVIGTGEELRGAKLKSTLEKFKK